MSLVRAAYPRPVLVVLAAAMLGYLLVWSLAQPKLIYTDEVVFARDMARVAQGDWSQPGIPHPPLYIGSGGLAVWLFGANLPALRLVGGLSLILTLGLIPLACYAFLGPAPRAAMLAVGLYALHPLAIQGSLLLDIDNTIFTPAMLLFVTTLVLSEPLSARRRIMLVGCAWAAMLWTKLLPGALVVTASAVVVYGLRRRLIGSTLLGLLAGGLLFGLSLALVAWLTGFPLSSFAKTFQRVSAPASGGSGKLLTRAVMGGGITLVWLAVPLIILYTQVVWQRCVAFVKTRQAAPIDLVVAPAVGGLVLFSLGNDLPMGFPRYHYPLLVLMLISVSGLIVQHWPADRRSIKVAGAAALVYAGYALFTYPDPLLPQYLLTFDTASLAERLQFALRLQVITLLVPLAGLWLGCWLGIRSQGNGGQGLGVRPSDYEQTENLQRESPAIPSRPVKTSLLLSCVVYCVIGWMVMLVAQTRAEYATGYEYGRSGGVEVAGTVRSTTRAADQIIAPLEIIYAAERPGDFVLFYVCPTCTPERWLERFERQPPGAYVLTIKEDRRYTHITRHPGVLDRLRRCYLAPKRIDSYLLYLRTDQACARLGDL